MRSKWLDDFDEFNNTPEALHMLTSYDRVVDEGLGDLKRALHYLSVILENLGTTAAVDEVLTLADDEGALYNLFVTGGWRHDVAAAKEVFDRLMDVEGGSTAASEILGDLETEIHGEWGPQEY